MPRGQPSLDGRALNDPAVDVLAGDLTDAQLQQLLEQATPPTSPRPVARTALPEAGAALQGELGSLGWTQLHQQAAVAQQPDPQQLAPAAVDVTVLWSGSATAGLRVERRHAIVRLTASAPGHWHTQKIT